MKKFFTPKVRLVLILCVALAIVIGVVGAVTGGTTGGEKLTGTLLSPFRSGVAAITRRVERVYDYMFRYEALEAENQALQEKLSSMADKCEFRFKTRVDAIEPVDSGYRLSLSDGSKLDCAFCVAAPGRCGAEWFLDRCRSLHLAMRRFVSL